DRCARRIGENPVKNECAAVSVLVAVHSGEAFLDACLSSLRVQILIDIEILWVDDGSTDATPRFSAITLPPTSDRWFDNLPPQASIQELIDTVEWLLRLIYAHKRDFSKREFLKAKQKLSVSFIAVVQLHETRKPFDRNSLSL